MKTANNKVLRKHVYEAIVKTVRAGNHLEIAAARSGIGKSTLHGWLKRGAQGEEPFASFRAEVYQAAAEYECEAVEELDTLTANPESMEERKLREKVLVFKLERRFGARWARTAAQMEYDSADASDDDAKALQALLQDEEARELLIRASHRGAVLESKSRGSGDPS